MTQSTAIALYQPLLHSIALKIVGSFHDAEDIVQDTFLKWLMLDRKKINNTRAYLIRSVTNNCLNHLNSLKERKKEYLDTVKLPELFEKLDLSHLDLKHEFKVAMELIQSKLGPIEKVIFILREGFDFDYDELQVILNKKKENCRQLFCRAKEKLTKDVAEMQTTSDPGFLSVVRQACQSGQLQELLDYLLPSKK